MQTLSNLSRRVYFRDIVSEKGSPKKPSKHSKYEDIMGS
jgi:hypothetical protein